ncbi:hypothetical protein PsYK624_007450 [Phanerochaete sordida]|uniref:Uncharacterized protein n=1 Tax=Phanerochaete sordida TaxID=48140 RepID=A0A9P3L7P1_9APHY|nr:hypothetical protein PsYK624_007450 [Phanerochaete sordida]
MDRRRHHAESVQRAYDVQVRAGLEGAAKFTALGLGLAVLGHNTWPFFRRQTLAIKGFLVTGFGIFGLVTYAERALQKLEASERLREGALRKQARIELSQQGLVPTETAIAQWKDARARRLAEEAAQTQDAAAS